MKVKSFFGSPLTCFLFLAVTLAASLQAVPMLALERSDERSKNQSGSSVQETSEQNRSRYEEFNSSQTEDASASVNSMEAIRESMHQVEVRDDNAGLAQQTSSAKPQEKSTIVTMSDGKTLEFPAVPNSISTASVNQKATQEQAGHIDHIPSAAADKWYNEQRAASSAKITQVNKNSSPFGVLEMPKDQTAHTEDHPNSKMPVASEIVLAIPVAEVVAVDSDISAVREELKNYADDVKSEADIMAAASAPLAPKEEVIKKAYTSEALATSQRRINEAKANAAKLEEEKRVQEELAQQQKIEAEMHSLSDSATACCDSAEAAAKAKNQQARDAFLKAAELFQQAAEYKETGNNELSDLSTQAAKAAQQLAETQWKPMPHSYQQKYKDEKIATYEKALNYFDKAIEATRNDHPAATHWKRAAQLVMQDLHLDPNCGCGDYTNPNNAIGYYRHGSLNQAIDYSLQAAAIVEQKPASLTAEDIQEIDRLGKVSKAMELLVQKTNSFQKQCYSQAANYYAQDIPDKWAADRKAAYKIIVSRMGDLCCMRAEQRYSLIAEDYLDRAIDYNREVMGILEKGERLPDELNHAAAACYKAMQAHYNNSADANHLILEARQADTKWLTSSTAQARNAAKVLKEVCTVS